MNLSALLQSPQSPVAFPREGEGTAPHVGPQDPARTVMTDLRLGPVSTTTRATTIDAALVTMKEAGVRFLFVFDELQRLVGSVTSWDIQGEKPMQTLIGGHARRRADVTVGDVMEPVADWRVLDISLVDHLTVAEVAELMVIAGRRHLVVAERMPDRAFEPGQTLVRGLFSASRLQALLGSALPIERRPSSFAEYEQLIAGG